MTDRPTFTTKRARPSSNEGTVDPPSQARTLRPHEVKTWSQMWSTWYGKALIGTASVLGVLFVLAIVIAIFAPAESDDSTAAAPAKSSAKPAPPKAPRSFAQYLKDGDVDDVVKASCNQARACEITISFTPSGFGSDRDEVTEATRKAQKVAWEKKPKPTSVLVEVESDTTSVGGKEQRDIVMGVLCSREAAAEIDWDNVQAKGLRILCDVSPRVGFDD